MNFRINPTKYKMNYNMHIMKHTKDKPWKKSNCVYQSENVLNVHVTITSIDIIAKLCTTLQLLQAHFQESYKVRQSSVWIDLDTHLFEQLHWLPVPFESNSSHYYHKCSAKYADEHKSLIQRLIYSIESKYLSHKSDKVNDYIQIVKELRRLITNQLLLCVKFNAPIHRDVYNLDIIQTTLL